MFINRSRTYLLNTSASQSMSSQNRLVYTLASNESANEPSGKSITSSISIYDLAIRQWFNGVRLWAIRLIRSHYDSFLSSLGEYDDTRTRRVGLGKESNGTCDPWKIFDVGQASGACPSLGFRFVPDDNIGVGEDVLQLFGEEFSNERGRKVQNKSLI
jgi:hypothetical protein